MTHTKEPWKIYIGSTKKIFITTENDVIIQSFSPDDEANAIRIISCVNACAGLNPEAIKELIEAAEQTKAYILEPEKFESGEARRLISKLGSALAKVKQ